MIAYEEAVRIILENVRVSDNVERIKITEAEGRILAEDIISEENVPIAKNSAMDGFAVRYADIVNCSQEENVFLTIIEEIPAGKVGTQKVGSGEASKILTGAPVPEGADTVVQVEKTETDGDKVVIKEKTDIGQNIRNAGEDIKKGNLVLSKGEQLLPASIGVFASIGAAEVPVYRKLHAAIMVTGDELIEVDEPLVIGKVRNSNAYTLRAQAEKHGLISHYLGIAEDTKEVIVNKIKEGLKYDILITSGAVSVGEYDFVKDALLEVGVNLFFQRVAIRPGKPMVFGKYNNIPLFCLPGNPVSSMVGFEQFILPAIRKMSGQIKLRKPRIKALLKEDLRTVKGLTFFTRGMYSIENGTFTVGLTGEQGSGILMSMAKANCLIIIPQETEFISAGEMVEIEFL